MRLILYRAKMRLTALFARGDAGLSSMEMAVLAAVLLGMATVVGVAMTGKLNSLMAAFTAK
jgi:hypothetical protein